MGGGPALRSLAWKIMGRGEKESVPLREWTGVPTESTGLFLAIRCAPTVRRTRWAVRPETGHIPRACAPRERSVGSFPLGTAMRGSALKIAPRPPILPPRPCGLRHEDERPVGSRHAGLLRGRRLQRWRATRPLHEKSSLGRVPGCHGGPPAVMGAVGEARTRHERDALSI